MITIYIHVKENDIATKIAKELLKKSFVARASVDYDNISFTKKNNKIIQEKNNVVTVQSKGLLFNHIESFVVENFGKEIKIYSQPITQCNEVFSEMIRNNTIKI